MLDTLKKTYSLFLKNTGKSQLGFFLFFGFLTAGIMVLEPLIFSFVIRQIEVFLSIGVFDQNGFFRLLGLWFFVIVLGVLFKYYYRYNVTEKVSLYNCVLEFSSRISTVFYMSYGQFLEKKSGSIYKNFDRGIDAHFQIIFWFFKEFYASISSIVIIVIILLFIDPVMTLISLSMLPLMIYIGIHFNSSTIASQKKLNSRWTKIFGILGDTLGNFMLFKSFNLEKDTIISSLEDIEKIHSDQLILSKRWALSDIYTGTLIALSRILVLGFGTFFVIDGSLSFAHLFLFFSYLGWIYFPLSFIFAGFDKVQKTITEIEVFYDEFDSLKLDNDNKGSKKIKSLVGLIKFDKVNFGYQKGQNILKNLNFEINPGEKVAFVGNTGAGKSTIMNLLLRLWDIDKGSIFLDGHNINYIRKESLRKHIGIVSQDNSLFNTSIKENLLFAKGNATKKEIIDALKMAQAEFVFDLEDGIDTIIGERGMKLSGGEKQRISIARLFLKNPEILILDEATSALDNKTEKCIQKALDKLMKGRTSIIIAHRLSTIKHVDKIFVLENGKIVEEGKYDNLVKKGGKFAELANTDNLIIY